MPRSQEQARATIRQLIEKYRAMSETDRKTMTEAGVVHQFLDPLLEALGWPIKDPARYKYELSTQAGRPDMTLIPEQGGIIFVEAKRFGVIQELAQARRTIAGIVTPGELALPGNPYFDAIVPRAARLTCTRPEFAGLWQEVMGEPWDEAKGATDPAERQALRDELDALVAHLYDLSRDDFAHILGTFPLVFPDDEVGRVKKEALLAVYDRLGEEVKGWKRN